MQCEMRTSLIDRMDYLVSLIIRTSKAIKGKKTITK